MIFSPDRGALSRLFTFSVVLVAGAALFFGAAGLLRGADLVELTGDRGRVVPQEESAGLLGCGGQRESLVLRRVDGARRDLAVGLLLRRTASNEPIRHRRLPGSRGAL